MEKSYQSSEIEETEKVKRVGSTNVLGDWDLMEGESIRMDRIEKKLDQVLLELDKLSGIIKDMESRITERNERQLNSALRLYACGRFPPIPFMPLPRGAGSIISKKSETDKK